jgi:hypothetical protein
MAESRVLRALPRIFALTSTMSISCSDPPDPGRFAVATGSADTPRAACAHRNPEKNAYFGDLHVHTALSSDAWNYDVEVRPREAYGYAFGEAIGLPPNDADGRPTRQVRIDRPIDFAAVTDHAEFLGEQRLCTDPDSEVYDVELCRELRASQAPTDSPLGFQIMNPFPWRDDEVCGDDGARCDAARADAWREVIAAAEEWNDTTEACRRTTFIAYEYSSHRLGSNLHRNVIFKNRVVPMRPISYVDTTREWKLWELLRDTCRESGSGCDVLAIPHNANISNGRMFAVDYAGADGLEEQAARAALRASMEPIVEVMQHKGDSECRTHMEGILGSDDPLCGFEKFEENAFRRSGDDPPDLCYDGWGADAMPHLGPDCLSQRSYARYALIEGLAERARLGVNPFQFGLMASTDTHNGMAGGVEERSYPGHLGMADESIEKRLYPEPGVMGNAANGPGGLVGVWAEENSRDALFEAMQRREVFGTSGPRIRPRFYAGRDLPTDLCASPDRVARAEAVGIAMGGDLPAGSDAPRFAVWAARDPGTAKAPGGLLQRIQIIKGWVDDDGGLHQEVIDVAGGPNDASVDLETCEPEGSGAAALCGVWRDPSFDATRDAVYYARVVENPSCRYTTWQCSALPAAERPEECGETHFPKLQQERAWTSPIWYSPESRGEEANT